MSRWPAVVAVALVVTSPSSARADRVLADRVVAVVDPPAGGEGEAHIVLASMLEAVARIRLVERRGPELLWATLTTDYLAAVLNEIVNEILIRDEAARLELDRVPDSAIAEERSALVTRFGGEGLFEELLAAYDVDDAELAEYLARRRVVREFLAANVASGLSGDPRETTPEDLRDAVERWVRVLRDRARVRHLP